MRNTPITPPPNGVVDKPVTAHQSADLLMLKAQVNSPLLPKLSHGTK